MIVEVPTRRKLPIRLEPVRAVIIHTTGTTDYAKIMEFYTSEDGLQPHYMVTVDGTINHIVAEERVAYHCAHKSLEAKLYQHPGGFSYWSRWIWNDGNPIQYDTSQPHYDQWRNTWPNIESPLQLITGEHANSRSIGIELQAPVTPGPDIFTDAQYAELAGLVDDIAGRHDLTIDRSHIITHYDVCPLRRCNRSGSTDPGRQFNWPRLWTLLGIGSEA